MTDKNKRQKRFQQKNRHIHRQADIMRLFIPDHPALKQPHRYHKRKSLNCGDPECIVCMNPRKAFGEKTIQEMKFECQAVVDEKKDFIGKHEWEDLNDPAMVW